MEAIGQLVSGVAHELNNPLAAIIAFSQLIRSDERLPDDMKHDAGLLVQEADRTRRIVQNLLDFARQRPPERRPTSIATLVRSVLELQSYALSTNQIQVEVEIPEDLPEVDLDRAQMQQVLLNLTINAIQAIRTRDRTAPAHLWVTRRGWPDPPAARRTQGRQARPKTSSESGSPSATTDRALPSRPAPGSSTRSSRPSSPAKARAWGCRSRSASWPPTAATCGTSRGRAGVGSCFMIELPVRARPMSDRSPVAGLDVGAPGRADGPAAGSAEAPPTPASSPAAETAAPAGGSSTPSRPATGAAARRAPKDAPAKAAPGAAPPAARRDRSAGRRRGRTPGRRPESNARPAVLPDVAATSGAARPRGGYDRDRARPRILALDDEPSIRTFLKKALAAPAWTATRIRTAPRRSKACATPPTT